MAAKNESTKAIMTTISEELIGEIPVVGTALSIATGIIKLWNTDRKNQSQWHNFHVSMQYYIRSQIESAKTDAIEKELRGFDENLNQILEDYERFHTNTEALTTLRARLVALIDRIRAFQPKLYEDERYTYATAPFLEHYFFAYLVSLVVAAEADVKSYDVLEMRARLYRETRDYLSLAMTELATERRTDVQTRNNSNSASINHDFRTKLDVSEPYSSDWLNPLLLCSQSAAALVGVSQLMRLPVVNLSKVLEKDTLVLRAFPDIKADMFKKVYKEEMLKLHSNLTSYWNGNRNWFDNNYKWKDGWGKLHAHHEALVQLDMNKYSDCANRIYGYVFDIPGGRDTPLADKSVVLKGKIAFKAANGKYLSRIDRGGTQNIEPAKGVRDQYCIFEVKQLGPNLYAFRADNGKWLGGVGYQSASDLNLEACKLSDTDAYAQFTVEVYDTNHVRLRNKDGRYWQWVNIDSRNDRIEMHKDKADGFPFEFIYEEL